MTASVVLFDRRSAAPDPGWRLRLDAARRHTKFVRSFKTALALGILGLGGGVVFFIVLSAIAPPPPIDPAQAGGEVRMVNPRITGRDADGTPYVITAESAERPESAATATELAFPRVDFSGEEEMPAASVAADRGVYDQVAGTLDLLDGVSFSTGDGYKFESEHARVFVDSGRVVGDRVIMGEGPLGSIRAQSFEIRNNGESVVFTGNVVARLYPNEPETPVEEPGAQAPTDEAAAAAQTEGTETDQEQTEPADTPAPPATTPETQPP